jgi:hypothetical protein
MNYYKVIADLHKFPDPHKNSTDIILSGFEPVTIQQAERIKALYQTFPNATNIRIVNS